MIALEVCATKQSRRRVYLPGRAQPDAASRPELITALLSIVILTLLLFQAVASFGMVTGLTGRPSWYFWPFVDYPMYSRAHHDGDLVDRYVVTGILEDGTEVPIGPEQLGLNFWKFRDRFVAALRRRDRQQLDVYLELYRSRHGRRLNGLRLESHPLVISREGAGPAPPRVLEVVTIPPPGARSR